MKCILWSVALVAALLGSPAFLMAHPGHDHGQELQGLPPSPEMPPSVESSGGVRIPLALSALLLSAAGIVAMLLHQSGGKPSLALAPLVSAGSILVATVGCGDGEGKNRADKNPQPRHDVKQLETLFGSFQKDGVGIRSDDDYFYIESNAFPSHPLMIGITAWQQQVPLPQPYTGKNAWRIPLRPVVSDRPISAKKALYRGAIALAVNGVPIFNALNNRGEDAYLAGELDEYGGHCGRGDDYHYHIAPVHLEKTVGKGNPIAYALDGFPIYGYTDAEGKEPTDLDEFNGRFEKDGKYRYYATRKYPYINGGMRGVVTVRRDQIDPQPRDAPVRPAGEPLRGAKITDFIRDGAQKTYTVKYELKGETRSVRYTIAEDNSVTFVFTDGRGKEKTETYVRRERP